MSIGEFSGTDLAVGSVKGVRSFEVDQYGRLTGITYSTVWKPGENKAECLVQDLGTQLSNALIRATKYKTPAYIPSPHQLALTRAVEAARATPANRAPHRMDTCTHGYYAYYDGSDDYRADARISAVIEGYGECLIGTRGFRAEKARLVALCMPNRRRPTKQFWIGAALCLSNGFVSGTAFNLFGDGHFADGFKLCFVFVAVLLSMVFVPRGTFFTPKGVSRKVQEKIRRNYPDIPVYRSFARMVAENPPDREIEPSPTSDPHFWESR